MNHLNGLYESNAIDESYAADMAAQLDYDEQATRERREEMEPSDQPTITTERISTNEWVAVREDFDGAPDSTDLMGYGDTETEARENLVFLETESRNGDTYMNKPTIAKCHDCGLPTDGECLSLQSTNGETVTWNCGCVDGIDSQGMIATAPMYDFTRPALNADPADIQKLIAASVGMLLLIAIGAAAGVK